MVCRCCGGGVWWSVDYGVGRCCIPSGGVVVSNPPSVTISSAKTSAVNRFDVSINGFAVSTCSLGSV